jgi:hypothetical protein
MLTCFGHLAVTKLVPDKHKLIAEVGQDRPIRGSIARDDRDNNPMLEEGAIPFNNDLEL